MNTKRDKKIDLRLSDCEKEAIQETAKKFNMNTSQFIRFACEQIKSWRVCGNGEFQSGTFAEI